MRRLITSAAVLVTMWPAAGFAQTAADYEAYKKSKAQTPAIQTPVQVPEQAPAQVTIEAPQKPPYQSAPLQAAPGQEFCITVMSGFPNEGHVPRYQFFRLTEELAKGTTPEFMSAVQKYGDGDINETTPIMDVIENIANPVLRQVAPELAIANMAHLIDFENRCSSYIRSQVTSLRAYDASLSGSDIVIQEDALYLRQVLSDSLFRLDAQIDPSTGYAVTQYANNLVRTRDDIEFASYSNEMEDIEALYMTDLDGRLARSNDMINSEINRETLGDAVTLSDDMNKAARKKRKQEALHTLFRILNGM